MSYQFLKYKPSTGIDALSKRVLWEMLKECFGHFKTASVLTTHSMNEAEMLSNKIGIMVF